MVSSPFLLCTQLAPAQGAAAAFLDTTIMTRVCAGAAGAVVWARARACAFVCCARVGGRGRRWQGQWDHKRRTRVDEQEAAGAVGALGVAGLQGRLPEERCLHQTKQAEDSVHR